MKRVIVIGLVVIAFLSIYLFVKRSVPYENEMLSKDIALDSISVTGPVALIYDKKSRQNFWLKSYSSFHANEFDSLQGKEARVHYKKFLAGPFENRIFKMEIDSVVVFDQVVEDN